MKISFLGTGLLGFALAEELLKENYHLFVYNRTKSKTEKLTNYSNCFVFDSPNNAIENSDIIISVLADYTANISVISRCNSLTGKTFFQMGTLSSDQNIELAKKIESLGGEFIESPVLGSIPQIKTRTLITLVGASETQFQKWIEFFKIFSSKIVHIGEIGKASAMKLALNHLIASLTASFSMSLGFIQKSGIDIEKFMDILRESAIYAPTFDKKLGKMLNRDFEQANFPLKHLLKDVNLVTESFSKLGIDTKISEVISNLIEKGISNGESELDYSAIYNSIYSK